MRPHPFEQAPPSRPRRRPLVRHGGAGRRRHGGAPLLQLADAHQRGPTAVVGTAPTGGVGSVRRTFVGALIVAVVRVGMTFMGVSVFAQQIVFGVVLILAVAATIDRSKVQVVK